MSATASSQLKKELGVRRLVAAWVDAFLAPFESQLIE
jgi:hypothetical protein